MRQTHLWSQVIADTPEPGGRDQCQDLLPRHKPTEGARHTDVLVYAGTAEQTS